MSRVTDALREELTGRLDEMRSTGVFKPERVMSSPQSTHVTDDAGRPILNLCANNYLGLADDPRVVEAAREALVTWGFGMASVRFICGTQTIHRTLEERLSQFLGAEDTILFGSCFDANGGVFEALLDERDAVISDALNHASIIDGVRLCKADRLRYVGDPGHVNVPTAALLAPGYLNPRAALIDANRAMPEARAGALGAMAHTR